MKRCFKCGETKPRTEFYRHPMMGDGLLGKCKSCTKSDASANRAKRLEEARKYDRERAELPHRRALAAQVTRRMRREHPEKERAHRMVLRALGSGRLVRGACAVCGNRRAHAHHDDYSKPLEVIWLCAEHHSARHQQMRRAA